MIKGTTREEIHRRWLMSVLQQHPGTIDLMSAEELDQTLDVLGPDFYALEGGLPGCIAHRIADRINVLNAGCGSKQTRTG